MNITLPTLAKILCTPTSVNFKHFANKNQFPVIRWRVFINEGKDRHGHRIYNGGALEFYKFSVVPKYIYTMKQYCYLFYYKCVKLQNTNFYFVRTGF